MRRARRQVAAWWDILLYGPALSLPPTALPARSYPANTAIVAALRRFRRRLYLQRLAVAAMRGAVAAVLIASVLLLLRVGGVAMPLPLLPAAVAGAVFLIALVAALAQPPSAAQLAHAFDRRLGLREQLGSALEIAPSEGRLAAHLHERAHAALRDASAVFVLPWPSVRRERIGLIILVIVLGPCALLAAHAPPIRQAAAGRPAIHHVSGHALTAHGTQHAVIRPIGLRTLGSVHPPQQVTALRLPHGIAGVRSNGTPRLGGARGSSGNGAGLRAVRGSAGAQLGHGTRGVQGGAHAGGRSGQGGTLHLSSGNNSAAGGVAGSPQQSLVNLQNSISQASSPRNQNGSQGSQGGASQTGQQGQNGQTGQNGNGHGGQASGRRGGSRGQSGGSGQGGSGPQGPNGSTPLNDGQGLGRRGFGPDGLGGRVVGGGGSGTGPRNPNNTQLQGGGKTSTLGLNGSVTLSGAPGQGGRLVMSLGVPGQGLNFNGGALFGPAGDPSITTPGYVAPDSNAVSPDERGIIQGYFSPSANGGS